MLAPIILGGVAVVAFLASRNSALINMPSTKPVDGAPQGNPSVTVGPTAPVTVQQPTSIGVTQLAGKGAAAAAGAFAIPVVGGLIAAGFGVWGLIKQHHQQAINTEGETLNVAIPHFRKGLITVCSGVISKEISIEQAIAAIDMYIADFDSMVKSITKGVWNYKQGPPSGLAADYDMKQKPDPCNGACVARHYWVIGDAGVVKMFLSYMYYGQNTPQSVWSVQAGARWLKLPAIPRNPDPSSPFAGAPEITITW